MLQSINPIPITRCYSKRQWTAASATLRVHEKQSATVCFCKEIKGTKVNLGPSGKPEHKQKL